MELIALLIVLGVFIVYIRALINAAKTEKYGWFVMMLLFWPLFAIYYIVAYDERSLPSRR